MWQQKKSAGMRTAVAVAISAMGVVAGAQTIEKMKLTDGGLTCTQLYTESQQMEQVIRTGAMPAAGAAYAGTPAALPYGMNSQAIAGQAQAAGQRLSQDPQVMAMAQQYAAKAQAGTLTPQEQQQYAMLMMQNPAVQQEMQKMTGVVLGEMQNSGALQQAMNQALAAQGTTPFPNNAANMNQALANAQALGLYGGTAQNNTQAIMQANNLSRPDLQVAQQLMLQNRDARIRAAASDPQAVAQFAAAMQNYQRSGGGRTGAEYRMAQAAAVNQANTMAIANQGQRYQQLVAQGVPWQQALAQAQAEAQGGAAAPAVNAAVNPAAAIGGAALNQDQGKALANSLFGALAGKGGAGNAQAASLLGGLFGAAQKNQAAAAPAAAPAGNPQLASQAQARKEHLTSMFLSKGCKLSDVAR